MGVRGAWWCVVVRDGVRLCVAVLCVVVMIDELFGRVWWSLID